MKMPTLNELSNPVNFPSMNILISFLSPRDAYRPVLFSGREVFCGPDCETKVGSAGPETIKTRTGVYDIQEVVGQLPKERHPEVLIVKADCTGRNYPVNTRSLQCPRILIVGNTQHMVKPLRNLVEYALHEDFDYILSDHKRHHLHYFKEAGCRNVFWLPALNIYPRPLTFSESREVDFSFVGQIGRWHPYRSHIMEQIEESGVPFTCGRLPHEKAAEMYARSLISLNCSLNGDMNLRVFEVLASGGFLLTDQLSEQAGMELIFRKGKEFDEFKSAEELLEKVAYYRSRPDEAVEIARMGCRRFWRDHDPRLKVKQLMEYIGGGKLPEQYMLNADSGTFVGVQEEIGGLRKRMAKYEFVQDLQLNNLSVKLLVLDGADNKLLNDVSDLNRVDIYRSTDADVKLWDCVIVTSKFLTEDAIEEFFKTYPTRSVIVDGDFDLKASQALLRFGLVHTDDEFSGIYRFENCALLGDYLLENRSLESGVECFKQRLIDQPEDCASGLKLAEHYLKNNDFTQARFYFEHLLSSDRFNLRAIEVLSDIYIDLRLFHEAVAVLEDGTHGYPDDLDLLNKLAGCYMELGYEQKTAQLYSDSQRCKKSGTYINGKGAEVSADDSSQILEPLMSPKCILVLNNLFPPQEFGGYGRLMFDFANLLRERGHEVFVLTADAPYLGELPEQEPYVDRSLQLFGEWSGGKTRIFDEETVERVITENLEITTRVIESFKPDVCLYGNLDKVGTPLLGVALNKMIPVIHHLGGELPSYQVEHCPRSPLYRLATCSGWVRDNVLEHGYPLKKVDVVYPGAKVNEFKINTRPQCRKLKIAYASIVLPYKGAHVLIEALGILKYKGIDFECTIAGTSTSQEFLDSLTDYAQRSGISDRVSFVGNLSRDGLKELYSKNNVLAFPSTFEEPFGISQVEAMAAGVPVIGSTTGGPKEVIVHGETGLLFTNGSSDEMAAAFIQLVNDPKQWRAMSEAAQRRAFEKFDIDVSVDQLELSFNELLAVRDSKVPLSPLVCKDKEESRRLCRVGLLQMSTDPAGAIQSFKTALSFDRLNQGVMQLLSQLNCDEYVLSDNNVAALDMAGERGLCPKRILLVTNLYPPQEMGGYGRLMYDFADILRERGHQVEVLTANVGYLGESDSNEQFISRTLKLSGEWAEGKLAHFDDGVKDQISHYNRAAVIEYSKRFEPDLCLAGNLDLLGEEVLKVFLNQEIPLIHHLGCGHPPYSLHDKPDSPLYRLAGASNWVCQQVRDKGYHFDAMDVVYPGAQVNDFEMTVTPNLDRLRIAFASILLPYKGAHVLLEALSGLKSQNIPFSCTFAGTTTDQDYLNKMQTYARNNGIDTDIVFVGNLDRAGLRNLFATHNVLVFPTSVDEAFGISQVEAMAAGLPVIGTGTGGAREVIDDGRTGSLFPAKDSIALATALIDLQANPRRWQRMSLNARKRALELFDIEFSVDQLEMIFAELITIKESQRHDIFEPCVVV